MEMHDQSTRERILCAAAKLFAMQGYEGTTTREIVAEAGSSLSSIQFHFTSKEILYRATMDRTLQLFYDLYAPVFGEIDEVERQGLLNSNAAWNLIVELVGVVAEWIFSGDYTYEILLINRELLMPKVAFQEIPEKILGLYRYFEKLFLAYAGSVPVFLAKSLSFSVVTSMFDYGNYPKTMSTVLSCDVDDPKAKSMLKANIKQYTLSSIRAFLQDKKQETIVERAEA